MRITVTLDIPDINLVSDAQMAALALDHDAVLHTADSDFVRLQGLRWFNPMTGTGNASLRRTKPL